MMVGISNTLFFFFFFSSLRLYTGIHALKKPKCKTGAISESTTALNVDQPNPVHSGKALTLQPAPLTSSTASRGPGLTEQDQNTVALVTEVAVGASVAAVQKKGAVAATKSQADRKKAVDVRKKSLKRL